MNKKEFEKLGLEVVKTPQQRASAGIFELPADFPSDKFAVEWVEEDKVKLKEQRMLMPGTGIMAPGLTVYRGENGKSKPIEVFTGGNRKFVLMVRPMKLQKTMNAIYGNVGKHYQNREIKGDTVAGAAIEDTGMLPASRLAEFGEVSISEIEESLTQLNTTVEPEEAAVIET